MHAYIVVAAGSSLSRVSNVFIAFTYILKIEYGLLISLLTMTVPTDYEYSLIHAQPSQGHSPSTRAGAAGTAGTVLAVSLFSRLGTALVDCS